MPDRSTQPWARLLGGQSLSAQPRRIARGLARRFRATILAWHAAATDTWRARIYAWRSTHALRRQASLSPALLPLAEARAIGVDALEAIALRLKLVHGPVVVDALGLEAAQITALVNAFSVGRRGMCVVPAESPHARGVAVTVVTLSVASDVEILSRLGLGPSTRLLRAETGVASTDVAGEEASRANVAAMGRANGAPSRNVVFLNDLGFQGRTGAALKRQASSFLMDGWSVSILSWSFEAPLQPPRIRGAALAERWRGHHGLYRVYPALPRSDQIIADILQVLRRQRPDLVVAGRWTAAPFPPGLAPGIRSRGMRLVTYAHGEGSAAHGREDLVAQGDAFLGLDHGLFAPIARNTARRIAGIDDKRPLIIMDASDVVHPSGARRSDEALFRAVHDGLMKRDDVGVLVFGSGSELVGGSRSFGRVPQSAMPFLLSAADVFVSIETTDRGGQVALEAQACGLPVVASDAGDAADVIADGETGLLTEPHSAAAALAAIDRLVADQDLRQRMGTAARRRVESRFTLAHQAAAWRELLTDGAGLPQPSPEGTNRQS